MLVAGGSGAGKTSFTKTLLREGNCLIHSTPQRIVWCYAKHQPDLLSELKKVLPTIEHIQSIPSELDSIFDRSVNNLIILDNMRDEATHDKRRSQLFTRERHDNLSVIYLTQNLFHKKDTEISLNSDYMVIFKNPRDKTQFTNLERQFMPSKYKFLPWAFEDANKLPKSYLLLDMRPKTDDSIEFVPEFSMTKTTLKLYAPQIRKVYKYILCDKSFLIHKLAMRMTT